MKFDIDSILSESVPEFPKQIEFKLPELKLPKLKKVEA
jgi:hypothetical protein